MHTFKQSIVIAILVGVLFALRVFAFSEPSQSPPNGNVSAPLNVSSAGQSKAGGLLLNTGGAANGLIVQYGNVGIGTTGPGTPLDVESTGGAYITTGTPSGYSATAGFLLANGGSNKWQIANDATTNTAGVANSFGIYSYATSNSPIIINGSNGYVGIGGFANGASPNYQLQIVGGIAPTLAIGTPTGNYGGLLNFVASNVYNNWQIGSNQTTNGALDFVPSTAGGGTTFTTPVVTIKSGGNVGIGTTNPQRQMELSLSSASQTPNLRLSNTQGSGYQSGIEWWNSYNGGAISGQLMADDATFYAKVNNGSGSLQQAFAWNRSGIRVGSSDPTGMGDGTINVSNALCIKGDCRSSWPSGGTDSQTLSVSGQTLSISNGNSVTLPASSDSQTLSLNGDTLSISNGNSVYLSNDSSLLNTGSAGQSKSGGLILNTGGAANGLIVQSGNVGIGTTNPGYKLDVQGGDINTSGKLRESGNALIPSGAVMAFNLSSCPSGWSEFTSAQGRYVVGLPSGGTLGGTAGSALSNLENRPAGAHTHVVNKNYGSPGSGTGGLSWVSITSQNSLTTNDGGLVPGTNAPYIQLLMCQKN